MGDVPSELGGRDFPGIAPEKFCRSFAGGSGSWYRFRVEVEAATSSEIPPELRGREASARLLVPLFLAAGKRGIALDSLAEDTGYTIEHLRNPAHRLAWQAYMRVVTNLARSMSDEEIVAVGASFLDVPMHRAIVLPYRLLFSLQETYRRSVTPDSPLARQILVQDMSTTYAGVRRLFHDVKLKPGYTCAREYWLLRLGFLESIPRVFGLPSAKVTSYAATDREARYDFALPADSGLVGRMRERASWLFAAKDAATALKNANDDLLDRNLALEREVERRKRAEEKLLSLNEDLERRILERTGALELANRELGEANAELMMFSASIAHDLRTPLRAINGFASTVLMDYGDQLGADATKSLHRIMSGAVRMGQLIDALLSLTRITRAEMSCEDVDLGEVAHEVIDQLRAIDPMREVEVVIGERMRAVGDPALLRAMLENLLGNAWKFTRTKEHARIELARVTGLPENVFAVRDNGSGFDMAHADRLFTPFARLHAPKEYDGTGIGLAIIERIVRRHGGKLWVDAAKGEGATFWFALSPPPA